MIEPGSPQPLGATPRADGTNFSVYSESAESVELCLFEDTGKETARHPLVRNEDGVWHGFVPKAQSGQQYGYRAHGRYDPQQGLRHNPAKLLIDPYARRLARRFTWNPAVFDYVIVDGHWRRDDRDSAPFVPRSVVSGPLQQPEHRRPRVPWRETVIYETNVRGYTMRLPQLSDAERGRFAGLANKKVLEYLRALGVTSIELMPSFEFIDEMFLDARGLRNFWGYNTINFFCPAARYSESDPVGEFRDMVDALHGAGFEVILDVAYNHTGESDTKGPTLCFRGLDNLGYYRVAPGDPGAYINDTGTGNTINVDHPRVRDLILDSLCYWTTEMGVDGFRFDLATVLGRRAQGFDPEHPLLDVMRQDGVLKNCKLIAEPWDAGPGGYQLGRFPGSFSEWNDRYRDSVRRFWRGDSGQAAEFSRRLHGSSDLFEATGRPPQASINFVTAHDGFTLADLVSYEHRHNLANGEHNRDGHAHNFSSNYGVEGPTDDAAINKLRRRQRLNILATLMLSQGVPMLLGGDEFGNSQSGNNNAYAQDNDTGWLDWNGLDADPQFRDAVQELIRLRREIGLLRQDHYLHGLSTNAAGWPDIEWLRADGEPMRDEDWGPAGFFNLVLAASASALGEPIQALAISMNPGASDVDCKLPQPFGAHRWRLLFSSDEDTESGEGRTLRVGARSIAVAGLVADAVEPA